MLTLSGQAGLSALAADPIKVGIMHSLSGIMPFKPSAPARRLRGRPHVADQVDAMGAQRNLEIQFARQRHHDRLARTTMKVKLAGMSEMKVDPGKPKSSPRVCKTINMIVLIMQ